MWKGLLSYQIKTYQLLNLRKLNTAMGPLNHRQKIAYKTRYHWMLDLQKSRARARYPWIPREPNTTMNINNEEIEFPEMHLEFIVPKDLESCDLKPYVAWRNKISGEEPLTAESLFQKRYSSQILDMLKRGIDKNEIIKQIENK